MFMSSSRPAFPIASRIVRCRKWLPFVLIAFCVLLWTSPCVASEQEDTLYLPHLVAPGAHIVIAAAHIDSAISYEPDEAILLWNIGGRVQPLAGWQLSTTSRRATFPATTALSLGPNQYIWCAAQETAFRQSFGYSPACVWDHSDGRETLTLDGSLALTNHGGAIQFRDTHGRLIDALLYGDADTAIEGWIGPPTQVYPRGAIGAEGQVWQRKRHPVSAQPVDTNTASDWAGDLADMDWGRRVSFPGWNMDMLPRPVSTEPATVTRGRCA